MLTLLLKGVLLLVMVFGLLIGAIQLTPADDAPVLAVFESACDRPCWQGIIPGRSSVNDAIHILRDHPWVTDLDLTRPRISWGWTGQQPDYINAAERGSLSTFWDRVVSVVIPTRFAYGDITLAFDQPRRDVYTTLTGTPVISHTAVYAEFAIYRRMACPITLETIWRQPTSIILEFDLERRSGRQAEASVDYRAPDWLRDFPVCR